MRLEHFCHSTFIAININEVELSERTTLEIVISVIGSNDTENEATYKFSPRYHKHLTSSHNCFNLMCKGSGATVKYTLPPPKLIPSFDCTNNCATTFPNEFQHKQMISCREIFTILIMD